MAVAARPIASNDESAPPREFDDRVGGVSVGGEDAVGGTERLGEFELVGVEVDGDDPLGTGEGRTLDDVESDATHPDHGHRRPGLHPSGVDRRSDAGDHGAPEQRAEFERELSGHLGERVAMGEHRLAEPAEPGHLVHLGLAEADAGRAIGARLERLAVVAQEVPAGRALGALVAMDVQAPDDVVAWRELGDVAADRLDDASRLMAEQHGQLLGDLALDVVEIAVAQAARHRVDQDLVGADVGECDLADGEVAGHFVEECCAHE